MLSLKKITNCLKRASRTSALIAVEIRTLLVRYPYMAFLLMPAQNELVALTSSWLLYSSGLFRLSHILAGSNNFYPLLGSIIVSFRSNFLHTLCCTVIAQKN